MDGSTSMLICWDSFTLSRHFVVLDPPSFLSSFFTCLASADNLTPKAQGCTNLPRATPHSGSECKGNEGWNNLPRATPHNGSECKGNGCVDCQREILGLHGQLLCLFRDTGFYVKDQSFAPCGIQYHPTCIVAGSPFTTHSPDQRIHYSPSVSSFPFICELCTTRANAGGELTTGAPDCRLLAMKRTRMIDSARGWAESTINDYSRGYRKLIFCGWHYHIQQLQEQPPVILVSPRASLCSGVWRITHFSHLTVRGKTEEKLSTTLPVLSYPLCQ
jgi:hypothetical protein